MDVDEQWRPWRPFPTSVVRPRSADEGGRDGPTPGRASGPGWRRTSRGLFVPTGVQPTAEQRIVEVASGLPAHGMLTGWAALRVYGAAFFDGSDSFRKPMPVPVLVAADLRLRSTAGRRTLRDRALPEPRIVCGLPCAPPERAVIDAMRLSDGGRDAVVALDMAVAAGVTDVWRVRAAWGEEIRRVGAQWVRFGLAHADGASRSPTESRLRLIWTLDARLPQPLVNPEVRLSDGTFVGVPDLLDPDTGLAAEYDGALHRGRERHRVDNTRRERFVEAGLEPVTVVAGDSLPEVVRRLRAAHRRAAARPVAGRRWMVASEDRSAGIPA